MTSLRPIQRTICACPHCGGELDLTPEPIIKKKGPYVYKPRKHAPHKTHVKWTVEETEKLVSLCAIFRTKTGMIRASQFVKEFPKHTPKAISTYICVLRAAKLIPPILPIGATESATVMPIIPTEPQQITTQDTDSE